MSITSTVSIVPGLHGPGAVSSTETHQVGFDSPAVRDAFTRASQPGYFDWLAHVQPAAGCTRPIRLVGDIATVNLSTDQVLTRLTTADMPDGVIYKACGNRRASVCPSCSSTYQNDAYQLLHAGLVGGKGVPETVNNHLTVFATFTAPSFGVVHSRKIKRHTCLNRRHCDCRSEPCHARRATDPGAGLCEHGQPAVCFTRHENGDPRIGQPLCLDCYHPDAHVVWNLFSTQLWKRTKQAIDRQLAIIAKQRGLGIVVWLDEDHYRTISPVRVSHGKVGEFQHRGAIHFHALLRLDGVDPHNPDAIIPPPPGITSDDLKAAVRAAARQVAFKTPKHPVTSQRWRIRWGHQLDVEAINYRGRGDITDRDAAGYLAKYATKATETAGHTSTRITRDNYATYANDHTHIGRLITACWRLSRNPTPLRDDYEANPYLLLERWAHMLGFGGHFLSKARRYSVTLGELRAARAHHRRDQDRSPELPSSADHHLGNQADTTDTIIVIGTLTYTGTGWHTLGDALLANTAAAKAREYALTGREEIAAQLRATARVEPIAA